MSSSLSLLLGVSKRLNLAFYFTCFLAIVKSSIPT